MPHVRKPPKLLRLVTVLARASEIAAAHALLARVAAAGGDRDAVRQHAAAMRKHLAPASCWAQTLAEAVFELDEEPAGRRSRRQHKTIRESQAMTDIVLVRRFDKPIDAGYLDAAAAALGWCRQLYGVTPQLHFLAQDGLRCACIFGAPDAEAVRNVIRAGKRNEPEALWACTVHPGAGDDGRGDPGHATHALILVERSSSSPSCSTICSPRGRATSRASICTMCVTSAATSRPTGAA